MIAINDAKLSSIKVKLSKLESSKQSNQAYSYINTSESCNVFDQSTAVSHNYDY